LIEIGSKTAEKNSAQTNKRTDRETNRQTDKPTDTTKILILLTTAKIFAFFSNMDLVPTVGGTDTACPVWSQKLWKPVSLVFVVVASALYTTSIRLKLDNFK